MQQLSAAESAAAACGKQDAYDLQVGDWQSVISDW
jgi:hypothetical protein